MKLKLRAVFLLTSIFLTVMMVLAEMIAISYVGEPYIAERLATDVCVTGSVKRVFIPGLSKQSSTFKCTSKETSKEIFVGHDIQSIGMILMFLIAFPIVFFMAVVIVLLEKLFFKQNVPT